MINLTEIKRSDENVAVAESLEFKTVLHMLLSLMSIRKLYNDYTIKLNVLVHRLINNTISLAIDRVMVVYSEGRFEHLPVSATYKGISNLKYAIAYITSKLGIPTVKEDGHVFKYTTDIDTFIMLLKELVASIEEHSRLEDSTTSYLKNPNSYIPASNMPFDVYYSGPEKLTAECEAIFKWYAGKLWDNCDYLTDIILEGMSTNDNRTGICRYVPIIDVFKKGSNLYEDAYETDIRIDDDVLTYVCMSSFAADVKNDHIYQKCCHDNLDFEDYNELSDKNKHKLIHCVKLECEYYLTQYSVSKIIEYCNKEIDDMCDSEYFNHYNMMKLFLSNMNDNSTAAGLMDEDLVFKTFKGL